MNGQSPAARGNTALRHATKLRELSDRLRRVENRNKSLLTSGWSAMEDPDGNLVFVHRRTGTTHIAATLRTKEDT